MPKEWAGYLSLALTVLGYSTYLVSVARRRCKPHAFSWIIWALITSIVYVAQREGGAGPGAWAAGASAIGCLIGAAASLIYGEKQVTRTDWVTFLAAFLIIPAWYVTASPLGAVLFSAMIDLLACYPTYRKARLRPYQESWFIYISDAVKWIPAVAAIEHYTVTTILYPIIATTINIVIGTTIIVGRLRTKASSRGV